MEINELHQLKSEVLIQQIVYREFVLSIHISKHHSNCLITSGVDKHSSGW